MGRQASVRLVAISVSLIVASFVYRILYFDHGPTSDEFATYAAFLARLSADRIHPVALADTTSKLVPNKAESWTPAELQPYPPERESPPLDFVAFCGSLCAHDFMKKNLRSWRLKPRADWQFPFAISADSPSEGETHIVKVSRIGFDLWHRRAVFGYSFDCSGVTPGHIPLLCIETGEVLLNKANGKWRVARYFGVVN